MNYERTHLPQYILVPLIKVLQLYKAICYKYDKRIWVILFNTTSTFVNCASYRKERVTTERLKNNSYLGSRMEKRELFQAETLLMIILPEVWILSVSIWCGSNLFHAWTRIMCLHFLDNSISGLFVGVGRKVKIFTRIRLDSASRGSDPWKRKTNKENNMKCSVLFGHAIGAPFDNVKSSSHTEMSNPPYSPSVLTQFV